MSATKNAILVKMLDRLFAGLASGPNLNCRPHSSRQRIDWTQFAKLQDRNPAEGLCELLSDQQKTQFQARVTAPKKPETSPKKRPSAGPEAVANRTASSNDSSEERAEETPLTPEQRKLQDNWSAQQSLLTKVRGLAEDARDYEQDTGVHVLHVGFPLLSLPPGTAGSLKASGGAAKRLLAPIAFIPVSLALRAGANPVITLEGLHDGADFLVPNEALFAWLERQTSRQILPLTDIDRAPEEPAESVAPANDESTSPNEVPDDPEADEKEKPSRNHAPILDPWLELNDLVRRVSDALLLPPCEFDARTLTELRPAPRTDDENPQPEIVAAAVLGLFPMNNQGLLRDTQAMIAQTDLSGPVQCFLTAEAPLDAVPEQPDPPTLERPVPQGSPLRRQFDSEQFVTMADPCQMRAVRLARQNQGLVIHGPPGTGKSQTITNLIGDHLARGERVLLVCDKRTALDVVARRLEHMGLGSLCALIHDPQHDQRNLYKQVREQLEELTSTKVQNRAEAKMKVLDRQLQKAYDSVAAAWSLVMERDAERGTSFHERMGEWLESKLIQSTVAQAHDKDPDVASQNGDNTLESINHVPAAIAPTKNDLLSAPKGRKKRKKTELSTDVPATVAMFEAHVGQIREMAVRASQLGYAEHPWRHCAGLSLSDFLQRSMSDIREDLSQMVAVGHSVDQTAVSGSLSLLIPEKLDQSPHTESAASTSTSFHQQRVSRQKLIEQLKRCLAEIDPEWRATWSKAPKGVLDRAQQTLIDSAAAATTVRAVPLDHKLSMVFRASTLSVLDVAQQAADLAAYLQVCDLWWGWFAFSIRSRANAVLRIYGLPPGPESARQLKTFLERVQARQLLAAALANLPGGRPPPGQLPDDDLLRQQWSWLELMIGMLHEARHHPALLLFAEEAQRAIAQPDGFLERVDASIPRATALEELQTELTESGLFHGDWLHRAFRKLCDGQSITPDLERLAATVDSLEDVLRIQATCHELPVPLRKVAVQAIAMAVDTDVILSSIRQQILHNDISAWLKSNTELQTLDGKQLTNQCREVWNRERDKQQCVRDLILDRWVTRQRERLLASTGSRLSTQGADLRRRLTTRGERAMRLRQVISVGARIEGGDPLFDLRPVWMASPETVAQIFPREELFDVVIFDEASQCRLEEALPVLTRAKRVVIAGDPKQLPPTRFFESGVITSDNAVIETEQDLFEAHQGEVEDLLTAALSLGIQECHLDVHYRSRNADLVEFSNQQFYSSRLQAIPGHPRHRIRFAPISVYHVAGVYEDRTNAAEASQVCKIVADLLRRAEPPSIGIACFNLSQRDLILDHLDELAAEDADFAGRLAAARTRIGKGAFEGLFVKNLENVQGDERDHMIISTTYGPDKEGRFYRRFGPLGQAGGGRRLNVLITRAREEVHLVTSIPTELYRSLPPVPAGQQPGGGWLLFAYLAYAERLDQIYSMWRQQESDVSVRTVQVEERPTQASSRFASQLAQLAAARHGIGSEVFWGNDGFCVDIAFQHPQRAADRTLGLLCDGTRFPYADDPVNWDIFRMAILEEQGWQLSRIWTPQFFRDPEGYLEQLVTEANRIAETEHDPESIPVEPG